VDVGVRDGGDVDPGVLRGAFDRSDVAGRVDDEGVVAVVHQVAPVAELGDLQRDDLHLLRLPFKVE
jgi:hypothetical protein